MQISYVIVVAKKMHIRSAACVYIYTNRVHTFSVGVAHRNAGMDKILHRLEDMQSARRTQPAGRPERKPSANKSQTARPVERGRVPESPVASGHLQAGGNTGDLLKMSEGISIFPVSKNKIEGRPMFRFTHNTGSDNHTKINVVGLKKFRVCFRAMDKWVAKQLEDSHALNLMQTATQRVTQRAAQNAAQTKIMQYLAALIQDHEDPETAVIQNKTVQQLDEMTIETYMDLFQSNKDVVEMMIRDQLKTYSIQAKNGQLGVYAPAGGDQTLCGYMNLAAFTQQFPEIIKGSDLTHKQYFDSWATSDMVMEFGSTWDDKSMSFSEYLMHLPVRLSLEVGTDENKRNEICLFMHVTPAKEDVAVKTLVKKGLKQQDLVSLIKFTRSANPSDFDHYWVFLLDSVPRTSIGPLLSSEMYEMTLVESLRWVDMTVSIGYNDPLLYVHVLSKDGTTAVPLLWLHPESFREIFVAISDEIDCDGSWLARLDITDTLIDATREYVKVGEHDILSNLELLANMTLKTYMQRIEATQTVRDHIETILKYYEHETTYGDIAPRLKLSPGGLRTKLSFKCSRDHSSEFLMRVGVHNSGQVNRHDCNANHWLDMFPGWKLTEPFDMNHIAAGLLVDDMDTYYGPWSMDVLHNIKSFEDMHAKRTKDVAFADKRLSARLKSRVVSKMNKCIFFIDGCNTLDGASQGEQTTLGAPMTAAEDIHSHGLALLPVDNSLDRADKGSGWMDACPLVLQYHQSPALVRELYAEVLYYTFRAYVTRRSDETTEQLGDEFNSLRRYCDLHECARGMRGYGEFVRAVALHTSAISGTSEDSDIHIDDFKKQWDLSTMNRLLEHAKASCRIAKHGGKYVLKCHNVATALLRME